MEKESFDLLLESLGLLAEAERAVGGLYEAWAQRWAPDAEFWKQTAQEEERHAQTMESLRAMLQARPGAFAPGRLLHPTAIKTFIKGVKWQQDRVGRGEIPASNFWFVARDIETALIESRFMEIMKTEDPECHELLGRVQADTARHLGSINERLAQLKK